MEQKECYAYWLCSIPGVGNRTIERLLKVFGSPEAIYNASEAEWARILKPAQLAEMIRHRQEWKLQEEYERLAEKGIVFLQKESAVYPKRLQEIPDAPYGIFVKGQLPKEEQLSVAVIGARECSEYGRYVAEALGRALGENGIQVISGMARGIDSISQEAALRAGGTSIAVLGSGVDVCYPSRNKALYDSIQKQGGILSAYPPGTPPRSGNFPPRNRIVSGLADAVVVIEARSKSGTLITVDMALEQGKEVYVVPGRVTDRLSDGCNRLLKQGAGVLLNPEEFIAEMRQLWERQRENHLVLQRAEAAQGRKVDSDVPEMETGYFAAEGGAEEDLIYNALDLYPKSTEQLLSCLAGQYTVARLNSRLMQLCLQGRAEQVSPGHFVKKDCHWV